MWINPANRQNTKEKEIKFSNKRKANVWTMVHNTIVGFSNWACLPVCAQLYKNEKITPTDISRF